MRRITLATHDDYEGWREGARQALGDGLAPNSVLFHIKDEAQDLFADTPSTTLKKAALKSFNPRVPKQFLSLAHQVSCHCDPERYQLLYQILFRLQSEKLLLLKSSDPVVHRVYALAKEVRRDKHKMKAFVRFKKTGELHNGREQFAAWFEPTHHIVALTAPFFRNRFANMDWSILTPKGCAHWNGEALLFSDAVPKSKAPAEDVLEDYWKSYYASIFNPTRLKIDAMKSEMPKKYWQNLPEASLIPELVHQARSREAGMIASKHTEPNASMMAHLHAGETPLTDQPEWFSNVKDLKVALQNCRSCPLWKHATQAVPGSGPDEASVMIVGEQPGDIEDLNGKPFIGPAGKLLREIMTEVGMSVDDVYLTNAVKHFKFEPRGKRRLHKNPTTKEIDHCSWWLKREVQLIRPKTIVALGSSALRGITGKSWTISNARGREIHLGNGVRLIPSFHPSYILRLPEGDKKSIVKQQLADDLKLALSAF